MITASEKKIGQYNAAIVVIAALLFVPFLGGVHLFDWDEINFAESAREMIKSGDYLTVQINFIPFWEKPPLFIWMQVLSMKLFGINEFAARFPNALCGIVSLLVLFNIGRKIVDIKFGLLWVLLYAGSILPFFYFKSGIIDPWFNLFIFLGLYQFYLYMGEPNRKMIHSAGSSFFTGLAILTKGPVALLVFMLTAGIFLVIKKFRVRIRLSDMIVYIIVLVLTGGFWFILQILKGNYTVIMDFMIYQIRLFGTKDAGHGGFLLYHFIVLLVGVFPASVFAIPALFRSKEGENQGNDFYLWMRILFWVVLILFTIVRTKIVHYSSLCYFPLTFIATWSVYHARSFAPRWKGFTRVMILILGLSLAIIFIGVTFTDHFKNFIINRNWINDPFANACLAANGGWKGYEIITGLILIIGIAGFLLSWKKDNYRKAPLILAGTIPVFIFAAMLLITPRIEAYSQRAAIEFFKSVSDQDAYLETIGYKSYAHLFYGQVKNHSNAMAHDKIWLLTGNIDKAAYFSIKVNKMNKFMQDYPRLELLYAKNGFAFFKRNPNKIK